MRSFVACVGAPCALRTIGVIVALAGLCSAAEADIHFSNFNDLTGLNTTGVAAPVGGVLRLTGPSADQVGSLWSLARQRVAPGFTSEFTFRFHLRGGGLDPLGRDGADGFAFVIQNSGPSALQDNSLGQGGGLGYNGMSNLVVVEFDTWMNVRAHDPNGNHISVLTAGTGELISTEENSLGSTTAIPTMDDGLLHTVRIDYQPGTMSIFLDDMNDARLIVPLDIPQTISLQGGAAYVGFTGATGGAWQAQDIHSWHLTTVPAPGAALVVGLGALFATRRRRAG